jgi:hypothetical protein
LKKLKKKEVFMKVVNRLVLAVSFLFASIANANVILSLDPVNQDAVIGDLLSVNVMISGLGNGEALSLGTFDIDVAFDTSALSFAGYNLGSELGADLFSSTDGSEGVAGPRGSGAVNIAEFSFLSSKDLWDYQPGSFVLAELFFVVDAPTTSTLGFTFADLTDVNGDIINIIGINDAEVTGVPAPATLSLMGLALLAMFTRQKRYSAAMQTS